MALTVIDRGWMSALELEFRSRPRRVFLICPFIKETIIDALLRVWEPEELRVLTRFRIADFAQGASDVAALRRLMSAGASVRGIVGLHAKAYLFDDRCAFVTSANLTSRGMRSNPEFGCRLSESGDLETCWSYAEGLWLKAGDDASWGQLDAWDDQVSKVLDLSLVQTTGLRNLPDYGTRLDDLLPADDEDDEIVEPQWAAESSQAFVKFFGQGSNRATHDLAVLTELERTGAHWAATYPRRPRNVSDGDVLYLARLVRSPTDIVVFGRAIGRRHVEHDDDASLDDIARRPFKARWRHYVRVHHPTFVAGTMEHGVSLNALIRKFGPGSFATTEANYLRGAGNTDPRRAYSRQPAVRLARSSAQWLEREFVDATRRHGAVSGADLQKLDWPAR